LASIDPQIAFANEAVAAMKNRLAEGRAMVGMRRGELSQRRQRGFSSRLKQGLSVCVQPRPTTGRNGRGAPTALGPFPARMTRTISFCD
jgi:hypothetical protein